MAKINFAATRVGEHSNVLKFIGAVVDNDALGPVVVLEYCENGPLDKWLTSRQDKVNLEVLEQIQTFVLGIARGMEYLVSKEVVHRKLAARNCLLTSTNEVKVSGFGPSRMEDASADDASKGDRIPVKWTAPECLQSLKGANEKSDVWSFGVTMWEILSMGQIPYGEMRSRDLPTQLKNGYRLSKPEYAEDVHYSLMQSCWKEKPEARTTFADAVGKLEASFGLRPTSGMMYYYSK
ncbi:tyrosine-protein kinase receptor Tie-1-like [Haliotis rubra]|uniref:tyrosine-protein kinase receptor Tie-1-like n=1 Tax=Haliotis rubra TaxID=36100 RepID=UPI001EE5D68E|nr:tyrosine-protein kinase receptor Tie-1-like [Haliotis rubra]